MFNSQVFGSQRRQAAVLVVMLAFLVLITFLIVAVFSRVDTSRKVGQTSVAMQTVQLQAAGVVDVIVEDLLEEMQAGSDPGRSVEINGFRSLVPLSAEDALPQRVLKTTAMAGDETYRALIKQSKAGTPLFSAAGGFSGKLVAVDANSAAPSSNRRLVSAARWSYPRLLRGQTGAAQFAGAGETPDWVLFSRSGVFQAGAWDDDVADHQPGNQKFVIGRAAFNIYEVGGLLDVNAMGYPETGAGAITGAALQKIKDTLGGIVPESSLGITDMDAFVQWRNLGSVSHYPTVGGEPAYVSFINEFARPEGFLKRWAGAGTASDNRLLTRQDLIASAVGGAAGLDEAALPYLSVFTREQNAPSWIPQDVAGAPAAFQYGANGDEPTAVNRNVPGVRVVTAFTRRDGSEAVVGEPLIRERFPLSWLGLMADPVTNATQIEQIFCLRARTDGTWDYLDPDSGAVLQTMPVIRTLHEIAQAGREPTFWELLRAAILDGSVGTGHGLSSGYDTVSDLSADRQIFEIGLNLIDQYDADDVPTVIQFGGIAAADPRNLICAGVENIPYLSWLAQQHFWDMIASPPSQGVRHLTSYFQFGVWNPHRNATFNPGRYRIYATSGKTRIYAKKSSTGEVAGGISLIPHNPTNSRLTFETTASRSFAGMGVIQPADIVDSETTTYARFPIGAAAPVLVGLITGRGTMASSPDFSGTSNQLSVQFLEPMTLVMEKQVGANWVPYMVLPNLTAAMNNNGTGFTATSATLNAGGFANVVHFAKGDPRSERFGMGQRGRVISSLSQVNDAFFDNGSYNGMAAGTNPLPFGRNATGTRIDRLPYNTVGSGLEYEDRDGAVRMGTLRGSDASLFGTPARRPVVLNRPFRSVGEMSYAFRGTPWKEIDFQTAESADGALLDFFCLRPGLTAMRAGVVNLNTAPAPVIASILSGAEVDPVTGAALTGAEASDLADAIEAYLAADPSRALRGSYDLPELVAALPGASKAQREVVGRTLGGVHQSRTWNVMIDVIVQAGRYTASSDSWDEFQVQSEQRLWVHLAIDRITGKVIDRMVENVVE